MARVIIFVLVCLIFICTASRASKIRSMSIDVSKKVNEYTETTLNCFFSVSENYTLKWYKDEKEFYRYTSKNVDDPIEVFNVPGTHVNKLFSNERSIYLDDITYKTPGMYRCEITTDGPDSEKEFKEAKMELRFYRGKGSQYSCKPQEFNNGKSLIIACYFLVNGSNVYQKPWDFNWYKDNQLIYSYSLKKKVIPEEDADYINNESEEILEIKHPHVPGVYLDSQKTYKNNIVLHHLSKKSNGRYTCELTLNRTNSQPPLKYRYSIDISHL